MSSAANPPPPPPLPVPPPPAPEAPDAGHVRGSSKTAGSLVDEGKGRTFPCEGCGSDLTFHIGQQRLKCPFCGHEKEIQIAPEATIVEQDFSLMLQKLRKIRLKKKEEEEAIRQKHADLPAEMAPPAKPDDPNALHEIRCGGCGGTVEFLGSLTSTECPYCATPLQRENVHDAEDRIPADGVLPFLIDRKKAKEELVAWVKSRWFAPNEFRKRGVDGKFSGVYLPYWTFDSMTFSRYTGQRGEHYYVEVRDGNETKRERRTNWYPVSGAFERFFDDVLVVAAKGLPEKLVQELEPWPLEKCTPFNQQMLAGYLARTYETELEEGFTGAKGRMDEAIAAEVRKRIGGDEQRINSVNSQYNAITFKHLLLPVWLLAYRYHDKAYQVLINAATGEVQGERPWSWLKITLTSLLAVAAVVTLWYFLRK